MNAIKVHSGQNHTNSISFRGGPAGGGFRDSLRTGTGTGMSSDMVYPPGQNHKMGKRLRSKHAAHIFSRLSSCELALPEQELV